jgi:hypothetical protein
MPTVDTPDGTALGKTLTVAEGTPAPFVIAGSLLNQSNGYPIAGTYVRAYFVDQFAGAGNDGGSGQRIAETPFGEGRSDADGRFEIDFHATALALQQLSVVRQFAPATFVLKVEEPAGSPYLVSPALSGIHGGVSVTLAIPLLLQGVAPDAWAELGRRVRLSQLARLGDVARELVRSLPEDSIFGDWDLAWRHSVLAELERAFLDPTGLLAQLSPLPALSELRNAGGLDRYAEALTQYLDEPQVKDAFARTRAKVEAFADLMDVDWIMQPAWFESGAPGAALDEFHPLFDMHFTSGDQGPLADVAAARPHDIQLDVFGNDVDLVNYRDYLRGIWTTLARNVFGVDAEPGLGASQALNRLEVRFQQDFRTTRTDPQPANDALIPIVTRILTAPADTPYGLGLAAASLEP